MTDSQLLNIVTQRFASEFNTTPVEYPNMQLDTLNLDEWVRISVQPYASYLRTLSRGLDKNGVVSVQIFTRVGTGLGRAAEIADIVVAIFGLQTIQGIEFGASDTQNIIHSVTQSNTSTESGWCQINVTTDYRVLV